MTLNRLHLLNVLHRDLRIDSIAMKDGCLAIGSFDLAYKVQKGHEVVQSFEINRGFAPEIEAGLPHGLPADVWCLGAMTYQLL